MTNAKILIVEDENIVAMDLEDRLKNLGYSVSGVASTGEEAIRKAAQTTPDLVLMDINLRGDMDGVEAAEVIWRRFSVPAIYITAYADQETLRRAQITEPLGYIVKPFEEAQLNACIQMALHRRKMVGALKESEHRSATVLGAIGDAVITTYTDGYATSINPVAAALTGWKQEDVVGKELTELLKIKEGQLSGLDEHIVKTVLRDGAFNLAIDKVLVTRDGAETRIDYSAAPIKDERGNITGVVLIFRPAT